MQAEDVDIPFLKVEAALNSEGRPFRMFTWHYPNMADISHDKWYLFHDMLLRDSKVFWQIRSAEDVRFISKVIREHPNQRKIELSFNATIVHELMEELARSIQLSRIHKLSLHRDYGQKCDLSALLQAVPNSALTTLSLNFEPLASEYEALASAIQSSNLQVFRAYKKMGPECWSLIGPILSEHKSILQLRCVANKHEGIIAHILKENKVLQRLEMTHCSDVDELDENVLERFGSVYRPLTDENVNHLVSSLKSNSTLKSLSIKMSKEGRTFVLFKALAHDQIRLPTLEVDITDYVADKTVEILGDSLRTNTSLTNLIFRTEPIKKCRSVAEALKVNSTLKSLQFRCSGSDSNGITTLCESLKSTNSLTELNLSDSSFKSENFGLLSDMIVHNKSLKTLVLQSDTLYDDDLTQISNAVIQNKTLTGFYAGAFPATYEGLKSFGKMLALNNTLRKIAVGCAYEDDEPVDAPCNLGPVEILNGLANNTSVTSINLKGTNKARSVVFDQKIVKMLETNFALTTIQDSTAKMSSLLKRNRRLQSEARFKVVILSHNIARSSDALSTLPRELWCTIMTHVTHPGVEPLDDIIKAIFNSYSFTSSLQK